MLEAAVLGLRPHTYWTAAVVLAGSREDPRVVDRRRIEFAAEPERFVYHQAAEDPAGAPRLIETVREAVTARASGEIGALLEDLKRGGAEAGVAIIPAGSGKAPAALADIIASHALTHAAEGEFYRNAVAKACEAQGLEVRRVSEKTLMRLGCEVLAIGEGELKTRLVELGSRLGPPWNEDCRIAALLAWLQLDAA